MMASVDRTVQWFAGSSDFPMQVYCIHHCMITVSGWKEIKAIAIIGAWLTTALHKSSRLVSNLGPLMIFKVAKINSMGWP